MEVGCGIRLFEFPTLALSATAANGEVRGFSYVRLSFTSRKTVQITQDAQKFYRACRSYSCSNVTTCHISSALYAFRVKVANACVFLYSMLVL